MTAHTRTNLWALPRHEHARRIAKGTRAMKNALPKGWSVRPLMTNLAKGLEALAINIDSLADRLERDAFDIESLDGWTFIIDGGAEFTALDVLPGTKVVLLLEKGK